MTARMESRYQRSAADLGLTRSFGIGPQNHTHQVFLDRVLLCRTYVYISMAPDSPRSQRTR